MSDPIRYAIHLRRLGQIKKRPNQYPLYEYRSKKKLKKSESQATIDKLSSEIKVNQKNILSIQKNFEKKKPVNYECDKYIYDREVEKVQKELVNSLINKNKKLKSQLKILKDNNQVYQKSFIKKKMNKRSQSQLNL